MLDPNPKGPLNRVVFAVLGITAIGLGLSPLRLGHLFYQNVWGGIVFGPLAILFGILFILGAIFKPGLFKA